MSHPCRGMSSMSRSTWKTLDNTLDPGKEKEKKEEGDAGAKENERERESYNRETENGHDGPDTQPNHPNSTGGRPGPKILPPCCSLLCLTSQFSTRCLLPAY